VRVGVDQLREAAARALMAVGVSDEVAREVV
jgi:hypothetical protein